MRSGQCPKCGSNDVRKGTRLLFKRGFWYSNTIPITFWSHAALDNYVCANCGYVESYVGEQSDRESIAEKWPKAIWPRADNE